VYFFSSAELIACKDVDIFDALSCPGSPSPTFYKLLSLNLSLRHEVARLIVWRGVRTRPAVPSAVSYEDVRGGNEPYRALGHGTHSLWTGA
jgi:hypothetical protein